MTIRETMGREHECLISRLDEIGEELAEIKSELTRLRGYLCRAGEPGHPYSARERHAPRYVPPEYPAPISWHESRVVSWHESPMRSRL